MVEGGNDRLPHAPTRQSRLPQEIHDKFAGKSREVRCIMYLGGEPILAAILVRRYGDTGNPHERLWRDGMHDGE